MAINTNEKTHEAPQPSGSAGFESLGSAPTGSFDFINMANSLGVSHIDSTIEPYIEKMMKLVQDNLPQATLIRLNKINNTFAVKYEGPDQVISLFGLAFISTGDPIQPNYAAASRRLILLNRELNETFSGKQYRLVDARVIIAGYPGDMERADKMADTIVRFLNVTANPKYKNLKIKDMTGNEFVVNFNLTEARRIESDLSPHGVRPRMDFAMVFKAKTVQNWGSGLRDLETEYRNIGVVGGYAEIREKEEVRNGDIIENRYPVIIHITVCNAIYPLEGLGAVMIAAFSEQIMKTPLYTTQWNILGDGNPNPGMLEEDENNRGRPIVIRDTEELHSFVRAKFQRPQLTLQIQDGKDSIPGLWRLVDNNANYKRELGHQLAKFFDAESEVFNSFEISRPFEIRSEGVYGNKDGNLFDSRTIDYLWIAAHSGFATIDKYMRQILLSGSPDQSELAKIVAAATNSFYPVWTTNSAFINPKFIDVVAGFAGRAGLVITDPDNRAASRPIGSYVDGFGSWSGINGIVSAGQSSRGLNLGSYRSF